MIFKILTKKNFWCESSSQIGVCYFKTHLINKIDRVLTNWGIYLKTHLINKIDRVYSLRCVSLTDT
jgi:hypothetical protein